MSSNFTLSPSPPATAARVSAYQVASDSEASECCRQPHHCPYRRQLAPAYPDLRNQLGDDRQRGLTTWSHERFRDATRWLHLSKLHVLRTRVLPRIGLRPEIVRKVSEVPAAHPYEPSKGYFSACFFLRIPAKFCSLDQQALRKCRAPYHRGLWAPSVGASPVTPPRTTSVRPRSAPPVPSRS